MSRPIRPITCCLAAILAWVGWAGEIQAQTPTPTPTSTATATGTPTPYPTQIISAATFRRVVRDAGGFVYDFQRGAGRNRTDIQWQADGAGDATATLRGYSGNIERVAFAPIDPATYYHVYARDLDGLDLLEGAGLNRSPTTTQEIESNRTFFGDVILRIDNAAAWGRGLLRFYIDP